VEEKDQLMDQFQLIQNLFLTNQMNRCPPILRQLLKHARKDTIGTGQLA
jgi:hypothetical protein